MRTFSDYSEETPVQFVRLMIGPGHPWAGKAVKNLSLPPNVLLALVLRDSEHLIPDGSTVLLSGDAVIMSTLSPDENLNIHLFEYTVQKGDEWEGRPLSQSGGRLVVACVGAKNSSSLMAGRSQKNMTYWSCWKNKKRGGSFMAYRKIEKQGYTLYENENGPTLGTALNRVIEQDGKVFRDLCGTGELPPL